MICCTVLSDSFHLLNVPDSKSSPNTVFEDCAVTVTLAEPLIPPLVAVMLVLPAATAVTNPELDTVAIKVLPLDQVTTQPVRALLFASRVTTESCVVAPTCTLGDAGDTATDATGIAGTGTTVNIP